eukprot:1845360-Rhodomonas_salina.1
MGPLLEGLGARGDDEGLCTVVLPCPLLFARRGHGRRNLSAVRFHGPFPRAGFGLDEVSGDRNGHTEGVALANVLDAAK